MSSLNFECPLPTEIPDLIDPTCPEKFGQVQKLAFRLKPDPEEDPVFATLTDIATKAKWVTALAATDRTKIVITPFISGIVIPPGTPITEEGNNNNTINGIPILQGLNNVQVTGRFLNFQAAAAEALRALTPFSAINPGFTDLEVALFNESNQIIHSTDAAGVVPEFFPVYNFVLGSVGSEGLLKANTTPMQFDMLGDWDKHLKMANPLKAVIPWKPLAL